MNTMNPDPTLLKAILVEKMPFGKYKGSLLCDIPVHYLEWLHSKGMPQGRLGKLLLTVYEIKINGLDHIIRNLKKM